MQVLKELHVGTNPAASGIIRIPNAEWITARNAANDGDITLFRINAAGLIEAANSVSLTGSAAYKMAGGVYAPGATGGTDFIGYTTNSTKLSAYSLGLRKSAFALYDTDPNSIDDVLLNLQSIQRWNVVRTGITTGTGGGASSGTGGVTWTSYTSTPSTSGSLTFSGGQQTGESTAPTQATGTWSVDGSSVLTVTVSTAGANYTALPTVVFNGATPPVLTGGAVRLSQLGRTALIAQQYSCNDNGGETSALLVTQAGGGNGISCYKFSETHRPSGYGNYSNSGGYAAEFGTTDQWYAVSVFANGPHTGSSNISGGILVNVKGTDCKGVLVHAAGGAQDARIAYAVGAPVLNAADNLMTWAVNLKGHMAVGGSTISGSAQVHILGTYTDNTTKLSITGTISNSNTSQLNAFNNAVNFNPTGASLSAVYGLLNIPKLNSSSLTIANVEGAFSRIDTSSGFSGTITNAVCFQTGTGTIGGGTVTNYYGILVGPNTAGTNNYGIRIDASATQTLWVSGNANNTTAAAGIAFGSSRDTVLYRSAANVLQTDDTFSSALGTITADAQNFTSTATWNASGVTFTAIKANITDTASAAASLLADLQVGGASKFKVGKDGFTQAVGSWVNSRLPANADTTSATAVDVADASSNKLTFAIAANEEWSFEFYLRVGSSSTAGMKLAITVPSGATFLATVIGNIASVSGFSSDLMTASGTLGIAFNTFNGQTGVVRITGTVVNSTNAGSVTLQFAKVTSGTATVAANSYMTARRIS